MSLKTTFQIGFRDMRADLMRHHFTGWICVCVCVCSCTRGQTYLIDDIIHLSWEQNCSLTPADWGWKEQHRHFSGNCTYSHLCCTDAVKFPLSGASSLLCHLDKWREQCSWGFQTAPRAFFVHTSLYLNIHTTGQKYQYSAAVHPCSLIITQLCCL